MRRRAFHPGPPAAPRGEHHGAPPTLPLTKEWAVILGRNTRETGCNAGQIRLVYCNGRAVLHIILVAVSAVLLVHRGITLCLVFRLVTSHHSPRGSTGWSPVQVHLGGWAGLGWASQGELGNLILPFHHCKFYVESDISDGSILLHSL